MFRDLAPNYEKLKHFNGFWAPHTPTFWHMLLLAHVAGATHNRQHTANNKQQTIHIGGTKNQDT